MCITCTHDQDPMFEFHFVFVTQYLHLLLICSLVRMAACLGDAYSQYEESITKGIL